MNKEETADDIIAGIKTDLGITRSRYSNFNSFNVYKNLEGQDFLNSGVAYAFFTKPALHFGGNIDSALKKVTRYKNIDSSNFFRTCPFIDDVVNRRSKVYEDVLASLKGGFGFAHLLTNLMQNFENQDTVAQTNSVSETLKGYKITIPTSHVESVSGGNFNINFNETSNLEVTTFHKIWIDYIEAVRRGQILPSKDAIRRYDKTNIKSNGYIDYMNSVYFFLLDVDGKTIKYYSKYTGVFPTNVPFSAFNWETGSSSNVKKVSINYQYNYKEDMNPEILKEFNYVAGASSTISIPSITAKELESYTLDQVMGSKNWTSKVKVTTYKDDNGRVNDYLLFDI